MLNLRLGLCPRVDVQGIQLGEGGRRGPQEDEHNCGDIAETAGHDNPFSADIVRRVMKDSGPGSADIRGAVQLQSQRRAKGALARGRAHGKELAGHWSASLSGIA